MLVDGHGVKGWLLALAIPVGATVVGYVGRESVEFVDEASEAHTIVELHTITLEKMSTNLDSIRRDVQATREGVANNAGKLTGLTYALQGADRRTNPTGDIDNDPEPFLMLPPSENRARVYDRD